MTHAGWEGGSCRVGGCTMTHAGWADAPWLMPGGWMHHDSCRVGAP